MDQIHRILFISILIVILGGCSNSESVKPSSAYFQVKDKQFFITKDVKVAWTDADEYCRAKGLHLASVTSQAENDALAEQLQHIARAGDFFWTSGNDIAIYDDYWWDSIGERFTYTNWGKGQPNHFTNSITGETQHCVLYEKFDDTNTFQMSDGMCSDTMYVICNS